MTKNFEKNHKNNIHPNVIIEASAVIDKGASIGANTKYGIGSIFVQKPK